jgi:hypothetical protein
VLDFFVLGGGRYRLVRVGFYGSVNIGHDVDLELLVVVGIPCNSDFGTTAK